MAKHFARPGEQPNEVAMAGPDAAAPHVSPDETMVYVRAALDARMREQGRVATGAALVSDTFGSDELVPDPVFERQAKPDIESDNAAPDEETAAPAPAGEPGSPADDDPASSEAVGRSAAMMSGLVIISRITGFFRTWGQAFALGATVTASCYTVANNLPNQLYELVMGGMLITAFLPVYMGAKRRLGREGASDYASNLLSLVTIIMGVLAVLAFIFASQMIWTQSFSASADFDADLSVYFFRFFSISIVLYALSSIISGVLNAERDFLWSTAAPIFNNFVTTASFFTYGLLVDKSPDLALLVLALGSPLGVLVQVLVQVPALRRHGVRLRLRVDLRDPLIRETVTIGAPTLIVTLESFVTVSVMNSSALSVAANGASIIYYARLWYMLPYSVLAIPITTAMFTELSDSVARGRMDRYVEGIRSGAGKIVFMLIPFAMYLIVFAPELVAILASGRFTAQDAELLRFYLQMLSIALPFYGICTYLQKACSSIRSMGLFAWSNVIAGTCQVVFCLALTPVWGLAAVALCSAFFFVVVDVVTFAFLRRRVGHIGLRTIAVSCLRAFALGVAGAAVGWGVLHLVETFVAPLSGGVFQAIVYCAVGGVPALLVTYGIAVALRLPEASFVSGIVNRLARRR